MMSLSDQRDTENGGNEATSRRSETPKVSPKFSSKQWLQMLSTFIVFFNTWGLLLTFGVFQTYYEEDLLKGHSSSAIAWIATVCGFILLSLGMVTGPLYDRGYYRPLLIVGAVLQFFGLMMTSISTKYYQIFLSQGLCVGIGAGMLFTPSVAAASASFPVTSTRSKVMGLLACGSSIGGVVYPIIFRACMPLIGFPWMTRALAFVVMALYCVAFLVLLKGVEKGRTIRQFFDKTAFVDVPFMLLSIGSLLSSMAYYIPLLYLPSLTQLKVSGIDTDLAFYLVAVLNGASTVGRLLAGMVAAYIGPLEASFLSYFFGSLILLCWTAVSSVPGQIVWTVFWGMISGVFIALGGALLPLFCPDPSLIGTRSGMYWASIGVGTLIGGPIGGAVFDQNFTKSKCWRLNTFAGCLMFVGSLLLVYPIVRLRRRAEGEKASQSEQPVTLKI